MPSLRLRPRWMLLEELERVGVQLVATFEDGDALVGRRPQKLVERFSCNSVAAGVTVTAERFQVAR